MVMMNMMMVIMMISRTTIITDQPIHHLKFKQDRLPETETIVLIIHHLKYKQERFPETDFSRT